MLRLIPIEIKQTKLIGRVYSMREIKVNIARFERDRLPELLQGEIKPEQSISLSRLANEKFIASGLIAVWAKERDFLNPLPHFIVGSSSSLSDLCAWSAAFMKNIGPLTGIIRLVEPSQIKEFPKVENTIEANDLEIVSQQISIILAEVIARSSLGNAPERIELRSCLSTVSFAIFLAKNRGLYIEPKEIASRWTKARGLVQANEQNRVTESVLSFYSHINQYPDANANQLEQFYNHGFNISIQNPELPLELEIIENNYLKKLLDDPKINKTPKEDLVKIIDDIIPKFTRGRMDEAFDYLPFARLITQTTSGLANQVALLGQSASALPELILMLGVLNGSSPAPDILSSYNGVGWKLLSRLTERFDPFKRPDCDISFEEAYLYTGINDNTKIVGVNRQRIEIAWGVNVEVVINRPSGKNINASSSSSKDKNQVSDIIPTISFIERRLKDAMEMIRYIKDQQAGKR
ncbi:hypothetical protein ACNYDF_06290 [Klebsiella aerogenes]|uniref:hypothetical protein n=2 Tax=Klebsiella/Raoultella group TaxID=2890311 RepID=UPI0037B3FFCD